MALVASYVKFKMQFKRPAGTSRGILTQKDTYFFSIHDRSQPSINGWGECAPLPGLSIDDRPDFEKYLDKTCRHLSEYELPSTEAGTNKIAYELLASDFPSMRFGLQTALLDLMHGGKMTIFETPFVNQKQPIAINGLVWMDTAAAMKTQVDEKLAAGFSTIKLKVGAIDLKEELDVIAYTRKKGGADLVIRIDANGAFAPEHALEILNRFAEYKIHSIEQPIKAGQREAMAALCKKSPIPVVLDEELIGTSGKENKLKLLQELAPAYIILKPSLLGGFQSCREWIEVAERLKIGWWFTSALESNIGLNAISQFASSFNNPLPQGLGTGQLFKNNFPAPLTVANGQLQYSSNPWDLRLLHAWSDK